MPKTLSEIITVSDHLFELAPAELAGVMIEIINSWSEEEQRAMLNPSVFCLEKGTIGYPNEQRESISRVLMEGWVWLEREGLIARRPGDLSHDWYFVTRQGKQIKEALDLKVFQHANALPKESLHSILAQKVWSLFLRGEYETAIFQAFKELEVAVRDAGGLAPTDLGVDLMRKAFNLESGPLTDPNLPIAEREATSHLFAGAIGLFKNPHSHHNIIINDPNEASSIIRLASFLLFVVDRAKP